MLVKKEKIGQYGISSLLPRSLYPSPISSQAPVVATAGAPFFQKQHTSA